MTRRADRGDEGRAGEGAPRRDAQAQRHAERQAEQAQRHAEQRARASRAHSSASRHSLELPQQRPLDPVWLRPEHGRRRQRQPLDRDQVVRAAIAVADEEGPEAISMRRIASRLGVGTMSLYWHVASKEELLDLVMDAIIGEEPLPAHPSGDWRADLALLARRTRAIMHRHPWLVSLMHVASRLGPNSLAHAEFSLATIAGLGLDPATSFSIPNAVDDYVRGAVLGELEWAEFKRRAGAGEGGWPAILGAYREQAAASGSYPTLLRFFGEAEILDADTHFEFGLNCLLDGIAARIAARRQ